MGSVPAMTFHLLKAHASRHALLTFAFCAAFVPTAARAEVPVFSPASEWSVHAGQLSTVRGLKPMKMPCVISTEYDNGFVVRFSGGGSEMLALAIDFRQDVFKQGRQYDAMITIGGGYVQQVRASAFTPSTLIFNLRPLANFYNVAQNGGEMEIELEGNTLKFALGSIGGSFAELESCYGGADTPPVQPVSAQANGKAPVAPVESAPMDTASPAKQSGKTMPPQNFAAQNLPKSLDDIVQNSDQEEAAPRRQMKVTQVTPKKPVEPQTSENMPAQLAQTTTAFPAAAMKAKTPDAGAAAEPAQGAAKSIAAPQSETPPAAAMPTQPRHAPQVSRAVSDDGMATIAPPAQTASVESETIAPMPLLPQNAAPKPAATPPASAPIAMSTPPQPTAMRWDAKAGEDMKIVLSRWSERAGYDLQWQSDQDGKVAQDVALSGSFEDAVAQLLAENSAATGIGARVETAQGYSKNLGPRQATSAYAATPEPMPKAPPVQASIPAMHDEWAAAPGMNIQTVLDQWSSKAGVAVVWQSYMNVAVKQPVQMTGTYEQAVQALLDQYGSDSRRPVAQLNVDPENGMRTLLVDMAG